MGEGCGWGNVRGMRTCGDALETFVRENQARETGFRAKKRDFCLNYVNWRREMRFFKIPMPKYCLRNVMSTSYFYDWHRESKYPSFSMPKCIQETSQNLFQHFV